jgi:ribosome-associated protein
MPRTPKEKVQQMLAAAAAACDDKKAEDIRILSLDPAESGLTDYFLIATGNSDRQNVAITDEIEIRLKRDFGTYPNSVEGRRQGEWILMDYVDFIVHVFNTEKRAFYGLERLRKSATVLSIDDLNTEIKSTITANRRKKVSAVTTPAKDAKKPVVKKSAAKTSPPPPAKKTAAKKGIASKSVAKKAVTKKSVKRATKS